jgi:hypothetical protein
MTPKTGEEATQVETAIHEAMTALVQGNVDRYRLAVESNH